MLIFQFEGREKRERRIEDMGGDRRERAPATCHTWIKQKELVFSKISQNRNRKCAISSGSQSWRVTEMGRYLRAEMNEDRLETQGSVC